MLTRPTGEILAANAQACHIFDCTEAELCERSRAGPRDLLADVADPRLGQLLAARLANGHARGELRLRRFNGVAFEAEVSSFLFQDDAGLATCVLYVRDISGLRTAERAAVVSEQRLDFALEAARIGDWDMDLRTNVARRSLRHDQCFGYRAPVPAWGYDTFLSHVHPSDRMRVNACYEAAMRGDGDYDVEFQVIWPDGSVHWLWSKGSFYFDEHGHPVRVAGIQIDVTERRLVDEALRRSEERLQLAMRGSSDALWDLDLVTNVAYYSDRWLGMLGYDQLPQAPDAAFWERLWHPDDAQRVQAAYLRALGSRDDTYEVEFRMRHMAGHYVPVLSRGFILRDATGTAIRVSGTNTDLSERYALEEAQRARAVAESANQAKTEFLSRMSHELRTPLNAVLGFAQLLSAQQAPPLTAGQRMQVDQIARGGWHLLNLVDDILDLARIDSGQARLKLEPVALSGLVAECADMLRSAAQERGIELVVRMGRGAQTAMADRTRLRQILLNLLSNAVKYTVDCDRVVIASVEQSGGALCVSVTDGGPGLTPAQQAMLFQPFNRLGQEHGRIAGTGIGLVISKRLAELMGARLSVTSQPGHGCVFSLHLPGSGLQAPSDAPELASPRAHTSDADACVATRQLLYIEDDPINAVLMREILKLRPYMNLQVETLGAEGLASARCHRPDLILLDLRLPDTPGLDVLRCLKADPTTAAIPVIVVSASALAVDVSAAMAAGAVDYVAKPIHMTTLLSSLERALPRLPGPDHLP